MFCIKVEDIYIAYSILTNIFTSYLNSTIVALSSLCKTPLKGVHLLENQDTS